MASTVVRALVSGGEDCLSLVSTVLEIGEIAPGEGPEGVGHKLTREFNLDGVGVTFGESSDFQLSGQSLKRCPTL